MHLSVLVRLFLFSLVFLSQALPGAFFRDGVNLKDRVVILANRNEPESLRLAQYYARQRDIPESNIFAYPMPAEETVGWPAFVSTIWQPLLTDLIKARWVDALSTTTRDPAGRPRYAIHGHKISYLVVVKGVPLRISNDPSIKEDAASFPLARNPDLQTNQASVDSELSLLAENKAPAISFTPNLLFRKDRPFYVDELRVVKVSRLDGPSWSDARALVDHALEAESKGLLGRAYVDLGGPYPEGDRWFEQTYAELGSSFFERDVDRAPKTLSSTSRFDSPVLYFGWYSGDLNGPMKLPGFKFPPGAIAFHLHSYSCHTLRSLVQGWCGPMVAAGATATVGNVYEPYLSFSIHPELLTKALLRGANWGDSVYYALPVLSWQTVALGDPLYRPFAVSLETQWSHRKEYPPEQAAYIVLRMMTRMEKEGAPSLALGLGRTELSQRPSYPLALTVASRLLERGDKVGALEALGKVSKIPLADVKDWALVLQLALRIEEAGDALDALELHRRFQRISDLPQDFRQLSLSESTRLGTLLGINKTTQDNGSSTVHP